MTITATIAGAISMLAQFGMLFGGGHRDNNHGGLGIIGTLAMVILAPIAAMLVQMAISRTREYAADEVGARITGQPQSLASALVKLEQAAHAIPNEDAERNPATAHLFIINPLTGHGMDNLFATHPATENRIAALEQLAREMQRRRRATGAAPVPRRRAPGAPSGPWGGAAAAPVGLRSAQSVISMLSRPAHAGHDQVHVPDAPGNIATTRPAGPPHRRRHHRRRAAPAPAARRAACRCRISARCPNATARWCARSWPRVLRRLGTLRHLLDHARARAAARSAARSKRCCWSARRKSCCSTCPTTPRSICRSVSCRPTGTRRATAGWSTRCCGGWRATGRRRAGGARHALLDTPEWLMRAGSRHYGEATARAIAAAHAQEPALDLTVKSDPDAWAAQLGGHALPTGSVRTDRVRVRCRSFPAMTTAPGGCRTRPRPCRRGCSATSAAGRWPTCARRPAARPRSSPTPARRSPRSTARRRGSPGCGRTSTRLALTADIVEADAAQWHGGPFDAVAARRAVLLDRHHPPPSRHSLAQDRGRSRQARRLAGPAARPCRDAAQARRHAGLLHLLAGTRGGRAARSPDCWPASPACAAIRSGRTRSRAWPSC